MKNKIKFLVTVIFFLGALSLFRVDFVVFKAQAATDCDTLTGDEKTACEDEKDDIKDDIESLEKKLKKQESEKALLEQNLGKVQGAVYVTQKVIDDTQAQIDATEKSIKDKESNMVSLEESKERKKEALKKMIQENYLDSDQPFIFIFLDKDSFLEAVTSVDNLLRVNEEVLALMEDIKNDKESIRTEAEQLDTAKKEKEALVVAKEKQRVALENQADGIQEDVEEKEATIGELQRKLSKLQSEISLLTGKSYNAKDIKEAIEFASKNTGVPKGVLYGFLDQETSLGANTGQCVYKDVEKVSVSGYKKYGKKYQASIDRLYKRWDLFKDIVDELGYSKDKKVSCTIPFSKAGPNQGGAMGVAQFMSDTWLNASLQKQIISYTGHKNPDPWNLTDGVMAMAIKLRDAGATSDSKTAIRKAVINYYGAFSQGYYNNVVDWSKNYKRLFN